MKESLQVEIKSFVQIFKNSNKTVTTWEAPLVGFASAFDPTFRKLKSVVSPTHAMPTDLLKKATTVIAFFIPFTKETTETNVKGRKASLEWAQAYIETNELIRKLSMHLKEYLEIRNYEACVIPATHNFDSRRLISDWSHRHVAFIAGLGRFGLNNMLITDKGCCGRLGTLVTSAPLKPDPPKKREACLYRYNQTCMKCTERCVNGAFNDGKFDRHKCYEMCLYNEAQFNSLGKADVCGKCLVGVPCSHSNPVNIKSRRG